MRILLFTITAFILSLGTDAQKVFKNEVGIGTGIYEYKYRYGQVITTKNTLLFRKGKATDPDYDSETNSCSLPSLHYTRRLTPYFSFAFSYQYSFLKNTSQAVYNVSVEDYSRVFRIDDHQIQFGYNFYFLRNKIVRPYIGIGFNLDIYKRVSKYYYLSKITERKAWLDGTFSPYGSFGFSAKIYRQFSLKYDAAITTDSEFLLVRPINRFSVNYQF